MRSRYQVREREKAYFITTTIVEWLPVFTTPGCCDIIVQSLMHCRTHKALKIYGWVVMDNHLHAVLDAPELSHVLRDFKSFTAGRIVEQLKTEKREWLLNQLGYYRAAHKDQEHQVWQEGSHPQAVYSDEMMLQKLEDLHNNPVKRGRVAAPEHWRYSSAHEWLEGAIPFFKCDPWR